jgi:hypothetical protein
MATNEKSLIQPQTRESSEGLARRFVESVWNGSDDIDHLVTPDYVGVSPDWPGKIDGPTELEAYVSTLQTAFPDSEVTIGVVSGDGNTVWTNWRTTGTNLGPFMGLAPTGKQTTLIGTTFCRIVDGKIAESKNTTFSSG